MRPTVSEQLSGLRRLLSEVVQPEVSDPYAADVLAGALTTLDLLADAWARVPSFLRWDIVSTGEVLDLVGVARPALPDDLLDLEALHECHRRTRELLVEAMPQVLERPEAGTAVVQLFRDRVARYPIVPRPLGGPPVNPSR